MYFNIVSLPSVVIVGLPVVVPEYSDVSNLNTTIPEPPAVLPLAEIEPPKAPPPPPVLASPAVATVLIPLKVPLPPP